MMRVLLTLAVLVLLSGLVAQPARAQQSETDRLRDALRAAIAQTRTLEDERVSLQAKQAESDRDRERLKKEVDATKNQLKTAEQQYKEAVETFNQRLKENADAFDKWKAAYEEAADLARSKEAERAKFEAEDKTFKASTKACAQRNIKLVAIGKDLLQKLESVELGDQIAAQEPVIGFKAVDVKNMLQDYQDKILEQRANP
ncbi:hypothetical protein [Methyloferula stellata]|uniref:hypothetical protein n=1 Tax=Methyloferula stellata TaxID=876270 RepID=UPI000382BC40|nr:hypothetical protein [Methyloferula stellata]